ncbi:MAG: hypothetical protein QXH75_01415 [Sulfolobaceae archaeon]
MKAQSSFLGFLIAIVIIVLILIPTFLLILDYSKPSAKPYDLSQVIKRQINGGAIVIYFNSTPPSLSKPMLIVPKPINYTYLTAVYSIYNGQIINITTLVQVVKIKVPFSQVIGNLTKPTPLVYNFTLPSKFWNTTLILQLNYYNTTIFATVYPNETAFSS